MIKRLLIANRGEIACRVAATAKRMGIHTIAVYSRADAQAAHVKACDEAWCIGGDAPQDSYLNVQAVLDVAIKARACAVHPGYGFLSENEAFAQACEEQSIVFIGPPVSAIAAMGSKSAAKQLMSTAKVPLVPGYHGDEQNPEFLHQQADSIGYPVLIKASAGGGGKGMRVVNSSAEFLPALASCQREALKSFANDRVLIERYIQTPRHIEIQVFADKHGQCVYLHERDCSIQRRHQKVIEEAPAPGMTPAQRQAMGEAAVAAAQAVKYVGAGTVEFIVEPGGAFYFMEMNTRLQVEHPVTEMITGYDLVEWQLRIADGEPLPVKQDNIPLDGHSIEVRLYAENTMQGFLPSTGQLTHLRLPDGVSFRVHAADRQKTPVRIDGGVVQGDTITPFYDPMIAKLIVWGHDRDKVLATLKQALADTEVVGVHTNVELLKRLCNNTDFAQGRVHTGLIQAHESTLLSSIQDLSPAHLSLALIGVETSVETSEELRSSSSPWDTLRDFRLHGAVSTQRIFSANDQTLPPISIQRIGHSMQWSHDGNLHTLTWKQEAACIRFTLDGQQLSGRAIRSGDEVHVFCQGEHRTLQWSDPMLHAGEEEAGGGSLTAPMPGKIIALFVALGDVVKRGQPLLIMEAMKMEHTITAPEDGMIKNIHYQLGEPVKEGADLMTVEAGE